MKIIADLHTHTVASTHGFSTVQEMTAMAKKLGYSAMAVTDHGLGMPDAPHKWYFTGLLQLPDIIDDELLLLKGVEANAMDTKGTLDMAEPLLERMDWVVCSLHKQCVEPQTFNQVTRMWLAVAENPLVDMIGHPETENYLFDYETVTRAFAQQGKVVELNAGSRKTRPGNEENMRKLALCCKENGCKIAVNSDAHSVYRMDKLKPILQMLAEIDFPEALVVNSSMPRLLEELRLHRKDILRRTAGSPFMAKYSEGHDDANASN